MISDEAKAKYLKGGGNHCPYCGSDEIDSGNVRYEDELWAIVRCDKCGKLWRDFYKLARVEEYHAEEE